MANKEDNMVKSLANYFFWTFLLQGLSFVVLGILVVIYPPLVVALIAAALLWTGITTVAAAVRMRRFWREMPEALTREFAM